MNCIICKKPIMEYKKELNNLKLDGSASADICLDCSDKFLKWQQEIFAKLFPTKAAKNRFNKNK